MTCAATACGHPAPTSAPTLHTPADTTTVATVTTSTAAPTTTTTPGPATSPPPAATTTRRTTAEPPTPVTHRIPEPATPTGNCDPNYAPCVPIASDVDCAGGSGDGPVYVRGPIRVIGRDIYRLDSDHDGIACD